MIRVRVFVSLTLAVLCASSLTASAQGETVRVLQASAGNLLLAQGSTGWTVIPSFISDDDLAQLAPSGELVGAIPASFLTPSAFSSVLQVEQASDGSLYLVQDSNAWRLTPIGIDDTDLAQLTLVGELDGTVSAETLGSLSPESPVAPQSTPLPPTPTLVSQPTGTAPPVVIVSSLPRTGPEKAITDSIVNALRQALEDRGNNVLGRPVTYVDLDNASRTKGEWDPALEVQNADQAVSKLGAVAYIGPLDFGSAKVSIPVTDAANLVMVSPGATYPGLTRAVAGVTEPNEPDVYYLFSGAATMRNFARVVPLDDGRFKKQYPGDAPPPEVLGRTEIGTWVAKLGLKGTHWYQSYKDRFGSEPDVHALFGYEAMNVVLDGITRAGSVDRRAVRDAVMETRNYDGVLGTWSFDANGDITGLSAPTPLPH